MNSKLSSAITSYNNSLNDPKARIVYIDIYNSLLNIILNHDKYGFSVADKGCCGTGNLEVSILCNKLTDPCPNDSVYVFWDSYHPTERCYRVLVNQELYLLGAKKIGLFGAAPIGCLPSQRTLAGGELRVCSEIYNQAAQLMNSKLSSAITSYNNSLNDPKARIVYIDIYNSLLNIILNHDKYGFSVADKGCCGTGNLEVSILCNKLTDPCPNDSVYVFWDSYHPTERCYRVLVNQVLQSSLNKFF
ncbi:hypothetical protein TEA_024573 [Camellia sinensis var. sinensis]|uniref:Uncharacterized protein n=1 Tax=Camellia sinensis var. sinensis TaxID=542762 RepID=A0A4S4E5I2_CAMSN|nr:hypothetical protein TEA_024573 [Camellia sinensis var. sinensis]